LRGASLPGAAQNAGNICLAAGLRGKVKHISYDAFAGWPLRKPEGFKTAKQTFGFMTSAQF
jgi:hemolysin activation/secretion protein